MTGEPVTVELIDPPSVAAAGEPIDIRVRVRRPVSRLGPVELLQIIAPPDAGFTVNADLFEQGVTVYPGDAYDCRVRVTWPRPGASDLGRLAVQVQAADIIGSGALAAPPAWAVDVRPSLRMELALDLERVRGYDEPGGTDQTKVVIRLRHVGATAFAEFYASVGPAEQLRAGIAEHYRAVFRPGDEVRSVAVIDGPRVDLAVAATAAGPVVLTARVPLGDEAAGPSRFEFLEPRRLATATVRVSQKGRPVRVVNGVPELVGQGEYQIAVRPDRDDATGVRLWGKPLEVVVEDSHRRDGRDWVFNAHVVADPILTGPVRMDYDVATPDGPTRDGFRVAVRPSKWRH